MIKFTVEVDEFWMDEDDDLSAKLQSYVSRDVVSQIEKRIEDKVKALIDEKIMKIIESKIEPIIDAELDRIVEAGMITPRYASTEITITDHIKKLFTQHNGWTPDKQVKHIAQNFAEECKLQYNAAFANHIVQGMKEQGLLKDDVVQILLEKKP